LPESKKARHDEIVLDFVIRAYFTAYGSFAGFSEWLDSPLSREERNVAYCLADDYAGDLGYERYGVQMIVRCENHSRCLSSVEKTEIRPCYHSVPHYQTMHCSTMSCSEAPAGNTVQCTCLEVSLDEAITWKLTHDPFRNNEGGSI
jgi:hypothetical protein